LPDRYCARADTHPQSDFRSNNNHYPLRYRAGTVPNPHTHSYRRAQLHADRDPDPYSDADRPRHSHRTPGVKWGHPGRERPLRIREKCLNTTTIFL